MSESARARSQFLVLLALREGGKHGYQIARHIADKSRGFFSISYGALYPVLHKLEQDGLITGAWESGGSADGAGAGEGQRRRVYTLTRAGHKALAEEREHQQRETAALRALMGKA